MTEKQQKDMALMGRIIGYVAIGAVAWATLNAKVGEQEHKLKDVNCKVEDHEQRIRPVERAVIQMASDINYIKQAIDK